MARTASGVFENPGSTDDLVRDLEDTVTPWMAQESSLSANPTVYLWRRARLWPPRYNPTERRKAALPQAKTKARAVAT